MSTQSTRLAARFMVAPSVIVLFIWMIVPLAMTAYFSFRLYRLLSPDRTGWVGFNNYVWRALCTPTTSKATLGGWCCSAF